MGSCCTESSMESWRVGHISMRSLEFLEKHCQIHCILLRGVTPSCLRVLLIEHWTFAGTRSCRHSNTTLEIKTETAFGWPQRSPASQCADEAPVAVIIRVSLCAGIESRPHLVSGILVLEVYPPRVLGPRIPFKDAIGVDGHLGLCHATWQNSETLSCGESSQPLCLLRSAKRHHRNNNE